MLGVTHHGGDSSEELLGHGGRKPGVSGTQHPVPSMRTTVFVNERAAREEEEDQHNTSACCHGNTGQLMHHQSQYKSFSVLAAFFFFRCYHQVVSWFVTLHLPEKLGRITEPSKKRSFVG